METISDGPDDWVILVCPPGAEKRRGRVPRIAGQLVAGRKILRDDIVEPLVLHSEPDRGIDMVDVGRAPRV